MIIKYKPKTFSHFKCYNPDMFEVCASNITWSHQNTVFLLIDQAIVFPQVNRRKVEVKTALYISDEKATLVTQNGGFQADVCASV